MATYLPGVQAFVPQTQTFTPDYKFLQNVLSVRQDRFDSNYKEINKLYGQVVYAPLSRADSKEKRNQYANLKITFEGTDPPEGLVRLNNNLIKQIP